MPLLEDLYNALLAQDEKEAHHVATALEIYVKGSLNLFNHRTNVDIENRFVCYDIKELGKQLKKIGMLIVQDQVWGRVTKNRGQGKTTRYYMDEFHLLFERGTDGFLFRRNLEAFPGNGAGFRPELRRTSKTCSPAAKWRISLKIPTLLSCSTRPPVTGRFWRTS